MSSPYFMINGCECGIFVGQDGQGGGIEPQWVDGGLEVTVHIICWWIDLEKVLRGLRGYAETSREKGKEGGVYTSVNRVDPVGLPQVTASLDVPGWNWDRFICVGTGPIRGLKWRTDNDGSLTKLIGWGYYSKAVIPARFAATTWQTRDHAAGMGSAGMGLRDLSGLPYTTTRIGSEGEVFIPPHGAYQWSPNGPDIPEGHIGIIRAKHQIQVTRHYMPFVPLAASDAIMGSVNSKNIQFGDLRFTAGGLMFLGISDVESYSDIGGMTMFDYTLNLLGNGNDNLPPDGGSRSLNYNWSMDPSGVYRPVIDSSPNQNPPFPKKLWAAAMWPDVGAWGDPDDQPF